MKSKQQILQSLKSYLNATGVNRTGCKVNEKLVLIESDDWGAIRTPSSEVFADFKKQGFGVGQSVYQYDALESEDDLEMLFAVLSKHKGSDGKLAKLTANAIMANPDFDKIKASNYTEFHYEKFTETFKKYPEHNRNLDLWLQGSRAGVFQPQFHGREHLNYKRWLRVLQNNNPAALYCFNQKATYSGQDDYSFMEAYDWDSPTDIPEQKEVIADGLRIFKETFGYESKSFIAPCYNWDTEIESTLASHGVRWIQGVRSQLVPTGKFDCYHPVRHYFGQTNSLGMRYNVRNCMFEPSMAPNRDWVNSCMAQIASAFHWNKPAVICAHRINFIGFINTDNRTRGLNDLDILLSKMLKQWPDIRFISTDELCDITIK